LNSWERLAISKWNYSVRNLSHSATLLAHYKRCAEGEEKASLSFRTSRGEIDRCGDVKRITKYRSYIECGEGLAEDVRTSALTLIDMAEAR
jgi:hypothetical protein